MPKLITPRILHDRPLGQARGDRAKMHISSEYWITISAGNFVVVSRDDNDNKEAFDHERPQHLG